MNGTNRVFVMGNVVRDPEIRSLASGDSIANFTVAVNNNWTDKDGKKHEDCEFINIKSWRNAEAIGKYLLKGRLALVEGRIKTDKYEKDGQTRYNTVVVADKVTFLPSGDSSSKSKSTPEPKSFREGYGGPAEDGDDNLDQDIPF